MAENKQKKTVRTILETGEEGTSRLLFYMLFWCNIKPEAVRIKDGVLTKHADNRMFEVTFKATDEMYDLFILNYEQFLDDLNTEHADEDLNEVHFRSSLMAQAIANREAILAGISKEHISTKTYNGVRHCLDESIGALQYLITRDKPGASAAILNCWEALDSREGGNVESY